MTALQYAASDGWAITKRNLIAYKRVPQMLVFSTIQPIMFVLLFRYVFGGAIPIEGYTYVQYLIPGIMVQTATFGAMNTGIGLAEDLQKGIIERFRSLPMTRSAVLVGRTMADLVRNVFVVALMVVVGLLVGFRTDVSLLSFGSGLLILLAFAYALSWAVALIGLSARNAESAQGMVFPFIFPLTFASSAFVPVATMPSWLQVFARNQPVSVVINAVRHLLVGGPLPGEPLKAIAWTVGMIVVFGYLAVRKYEKKAGG